jgi:hypothetical protein
MTEIIRKHIEEKAAAGNENVGTKYDEILATSSEPAFGNFLGRFAEGTPAPLVPQPSIDTAMAGAMKKIATNGKILLNIFKYVVSISLCFLFQIQCRKLRWKPTWLPP